MGAPHPLRAPAGRNGRVPGLLGGSPEVRIPASNLWGEVGATACGAVRALTSPDQRATVAFGVSPVVQATVEGR